ncbi:MAG: glycine oxidase ThiO [Hyphomicrobiales bacterium]|nr:glycine oxidase ThiO [Hyphomicrobiales bacterium]
MPAQVDVAIAGAGVIGLSIGWRLAARGLSVAVFDRDTAGTGASLAATGMLAAAAEHEPGGDELLKLALESQALWPQYRLMLEAESGIDIDYRDEGTLLVANTRDEVERLRFRHELQQRCGLDAKWLNPRETRALEPGLRSTVAAGILCKGDHQVDPRPMVPALARAFAGRGGLLFEKTAVTAVDVSGGRATGLQTAAGLCKAKSVVVANGVWANDLLEPLGIDVPMRPLRGQAMSLITTRQTGTLSHIVWTEQIHLAPKKDGRLIVGATVEDMGLHAAITAGGALALLEGLHRALPSSEEMEVEAIWSGFRPTSDDDAPIMGETAIPGLTIATGHHRNGILLAPVTGQAFEQLLVDGAMRGAAPGFGLERFGKPASPAIREPAGE